jgi:hypothetical protein
MSNWTNNFIEKMKYLKRCCWIFLTAVATRTCRSWFNLSNSSWDSSKRVWKSQSADVPAPSA